jgi:predicted RNA-binding protein Jag
MSEHELTATATTAPAEDDASEESSSPKQHVSLAEKVAIAEATAQRLFALFGAPLPVIECRAEEDQVVVQLSELDPALQPQGDTRVLESLQFVLNKAINRTSMDRTRLSLDTDGFRRRRPEGLDKVAQALAEKSKLLGKSLAIGPLGQGDLRFLTAQLSRTPGLAVLHHGAPEQRKLIVAPKSLVAELAEGAALDAPGHEGQGHGGGHRRRRRRR